VSRIDELIAEHCPHGVDFLPLRDVARIRNGRDYKALGSGDVPVYGSGGILTYVDTYAYDKPSVLIPRKGSLGNLFYVEGPFWTVDTIFFTEVNRDLIEPKFFYYYLATLGLGDMNQAGGVPSQTQSVLNQLKIAVPPLVVQLDIVRILDLFTSLEAELNAELEARRRQYARYRDSLLTFGQEDSVRWMPFGDAATIVRGASPRPIQSFLTTAEDGINWVKIGDVAPAGKYITETAEKIKPDGAVKSRRVEPGDFVLSNSMSFGRPYIMRIPGCIHDGWLAIKDFDTTFVPDFLYHLLRSTPVYRTMESKAGGGTVKNLNADIVKALVLPVPSMQEQRRIVAILDKFDALVNDLSIGLPAEIKARRQQYEHYRDRLLTFREAV
jgi:type I restriction enzyme S subunit